MSDNGDFEPAITKSGRPCALCISQGKLCSIHRVREGEHAWGTRYPLGRKPKYTKDMVAKALVQAKGMPYHAARVLGCSAKTVFNALNRWPELKEIREEAKGEFLDLAEHQLVAAVREGEGWAIRFTLSTVGRSRGYGEKVEIVQEEGQLTMPELLSLLSPETKRQILVEIRAAAERKQLPGVVIGEDDDIVDAEIID